MTWDELADRVRFGRLVAVDGWSYDFRRSDLPWSARFIVGEKESHASTDEAYLLLWTMANRMYLVRRTVAWPTYADLLVAYSTPLHDPDDPSKRAPSAEVAARRRRIRSLQPDDVPAGCMDRVISFLEGKTQVPEIGRSFVHFALCGHGDASLGDANYRSPSGECYWSTAASRSWPRSQLVAETGSGSSSSAGPLLLGLAAMAAAIGAAFWSGR